jgi:hypothetical protein
MEHTHTAYSLPCRVADGNPTSRPLIQSPTPIPACRDPAGDGTQHGKFNNCHGITYDPRTGLIAVTDRGNSRIEMFDFDSTGEKFAYQVRRH